MEKTMYNSLRSKIFGIGLAGSLTILSGCTTAEINGADVASAIFGLNAMAPNSGFTYEQREALGYISDFAGEQGRKIHEMNVARKGRDEINITIEDEGDYQERYPTTPIYNESNPVPVREYTEEDYARLRREFYRN